MEIWIRPLNIGAAACFLVVATACAQPSQSGSSEEDFARGVERGYEMALSDISDCAIEDGGLEDFQDCVANKALGMSITLLDESDDPQAQRGDDAASEAFQVWAGIQLRLES